MVEVNCEGGEEREGCDALERPWPGSSTGSYLNLAKAVSAWILCQRCAVVEGPFS